MIAETAHGLVCANAGVDASNVEGGTLALLPVDPDGLRANCMRRSLRGTAVGAFGVVSPTRSGVRGATGLVNVAIGCAGMPAGSTCGGRPHHGRELEATIVALAERSRRRPGS